MTEPETELDEETPEAEEPEPDPDAMRDEERLDREAAKAEDYELDHHFGSATLTPGIHLGVPEAAYHADHHAIGSTGLRLMLPPQSPYHYWRDYLDPTRPLSYGDTPARVHGRVLHSLILEPERAERAILPVPRFKRSTKEGKRDWANWLDDNGLPDKLEGLTQAMIPAEVSRMEGDDEDRVYLVDQAELAELRAICAVVHVSDFWARLVAPGDGISEVTAVQEFETAEGLKYLGKARVDCWCKFGSGGLLIDIKTMERPGDVQRALFNLGGPQQAAWYTDIMGACLQDAVAEDPGSLTFAYIVIERGHRRPTVRFEVASEDWLAFGRHQNDRAVELYQTSLACGLWPGPGQELVKDARGTTLKSKTSIVSTPKWAETHAGLRWHH
jgi:hypothetical protein